MSKTATPEAATPFKARRQPTRSASRKTVARIREAAAAIIEKEGLPQLNSNRIAKVAGISVGTLYKFFPDKRSILASVVEEWAAERASALGKLALLNANAPLEVKIEDWFRFYVETPASHVLVISAALKYYPELASIAGGFSAESTNLIKRCLVKDGCKLDEDELHARATRIHDLGSFLLSRIVQADDHAREDLMTWSLGLMRKSITDTLAEQPAAVAGSRRLAG